MTSWQVKSTTDSYAQTASFRFNNYVVNPHVIDLVGTVQGKTLLDIGCGFGRYLEIFRQYNPSKLVGCDISANQIESCRSKFENDNRVELHHLDFTNVDSIIPLGNNRYDIIYSVFVILYMVTLKEIEGFFDNCYRCLNLDGRMIIGTLDIASATAVPDVFEVLNFPVTALNNNQYDDGSPIQIQITDGCIVTSFQRDFTTLQKIMKQVGFKKIKRHPLTLEEPALQGFSKREFELIKQSQIFSLIEASK